MTKDQVKDIAKCLTKKAFFHYYFDKPKEDKTEQMPLDIFFPKERKISSLILGLSTSLGTGLWEELAKAIAEKNNFTIKDPKDLKQPKPIPKHLSEIIDKFTSIRDASTKGKQVSLIDKYIPEIIELTKNNLPDGTNFENITKGEGVDLLFEKDDKEYAFDIKTVQINAGSGIKFNKTILKWYAYRYYQRNSSNNNYKFEARIVFPYNPYKDSSWWDEEEGKAKPLTKHDVFVEDEFWGFLSGLNEGETWDSIKNAFQELVDEGFNDIYKQSFNLKGKIFRAVLFANKINCKLLSSIDNKNIETYKRITSQLKWKCINCEVNFEASINNIIKKQKGKNKCSNCEVIFFEDMTKIY